MRLVIKICFILLVMFSLAAAEFNNSSNMNEDKSSIDTAPVEINEFSDEAEIPAEAPETGFDEDSGETAIEGVVEDSPDEIDEYTEDDEGSIEDLETEIDEDPDIFKDESFTKTPAAEIFEHFKKDEDESFVLSSEIPVEAETASDQKPEPPASQDGKMTASEKKERDRQELVETPQRLTRL